MHAYEFLCGLYERERERERDFVNVCVCMQV